MVLSWIICRYLHKIDMRKFGDFSSKFCAKNTSFIFAEKRLFRRNSVALLLHSTVH